MAARLFQGKENATRKLLLMKQLDYELRIGGSRRRTKF